MKRIFIAYSVVHSLPNMLLLRHPTCVCMQRLILKVRVYLFHTEYENIFVALHTQSFNYTTSLITIKIIIYCLQ